MVIGILSNEMPEKLFEGYLVEKQAIKSFVLTMRWDPPAYWKLYIMMYVALSQFCHHLVLNSMHILLMILVDSHTFFL